ncbi:hypothetical protein [Paremcibacter congregatus]|uniref:hypothetical protein n=1 Tax=Paremcibacter congregatus TaxID=2043170 RepID=UPI0030EBFE1E|tara:strand:- start:10468 stop:10698 length:231 start_codon:yes stop_codon:yes gene_type:complete
MDQLNLYNILSVAEAAQTLQDIYPDPFYETSRRKYYAAAHNNVDNTRFWEDVEALLITLRDQQDFNNATPCPSDTS